MNLARLIGGCAIATFGLIVMLKARPLGEWWSNEEVAQTRRSSFFSPDSIERLAEMYDSSGQRRLSVFQVRFFGGFMMLIGIGLAISSFTAHG